MLEAAQLTQRKILCALPRRKTFESKIDGIGTGLIGMDSRRQVPCWSEDFGVLVLSVMVDACVIRLCRDFRQYKLLGHFWVKVGLVNYFELL